MWNKASPRLPEPHVAEAAESEKRIEQAEAVSTALLALLEALSPAERAVFLLREVFSYEYEAIAEIVDKNEAHCRKMAQRARVGGGPGLVAYEGDRPQSAWSFEVADGKIQTAYAVVNPDKLRHLRERSEAG
jgi:hypothetical protein